MGMIEEFKNIKGYNGDYQISNLGRVKSLKFGKEKILKNIKDGKGYFFVGLSKNNKSKLILVHQLVAIAFLGHMVNGLVKVVNHVDFDRTNNKLDNLELVTTRENTNRKHIKSSSRYVGVSWSKSSSKWEARIRVNGKQLYLGYFVDELEASKAYQKALKTLNKTS
tara:strand:- start:284 stop:781 length:498 start_codon:yes stop_codon:yes gene_type:complete